MPDLIRDVNTFFGAGYRLVYERAGGPVTIRHGVRGNRAIPLDHWLEADVRWTCNPGSTDQPHYWSGFHIFSTREIAERYQRKFKHMPTLVACEAQDTWGKPTNADVVLARWLKITATDWAAAIAENA